MNHGSFERSNRIWPSSLARAFVALTFYVVLGTGCKGPCRELAERICDCEVNARERAACIQEIDNNESEREVTSEEEELCMERLDTCDCDALERGDLIACGLSKRRETEE